MTMNYELKRRHEVCFKARIRLTNLIVNSEAKNFNSNAGPRSLKSFRLPCQVQRLEVSVVHVVDLVLHCTVCTISSKGPLQAKSTCTRLAASGASETEKSHPRLPLNIGI